MGTVIVVVVVVAAVVALIAFIGSGSSLSGLGGGDLRMDGDRPRAPRMPGGPVDYGPPADEDPDDREEEIRSLIEASNMRRVRRGEEPLDVDAEYARLTAPTPPSQDPEAVAEIRQVVQARNERRISRGEEPLDVEAEVRRMLEEFGG